MKNILIVDDHKIVRTGIRSLLEKYNDKIKVVAEAYNGETAIRLFRETKPDIVLMDMRMPGIGGLEATRKILQFEPHAKVIALTVCEEEPFPSKFLQIGGAAYITKHADIEEIMKAIEKVNAGEHYIKPDIAQKIAVKTILGSEKSLLDKLSERELEIFIMISNGLTVHEIANKLSLSSKTIHSYRYRLYKKLHVQNDVELAYLALQNKMVDAEKIM